ncbi:MAG: hypothetical protein ACOVK2_02440 [Candidatus Fonsibacter sp.]|jgi:hypothetical protein
MTTKNTGKPRQVKKDPVKNENYYGVFNHMIEESVIEENSVSSNVFGWTVYALIIMFLTYIFFLL